MVWRCPSCGQALEAEDSEVDFFGECLVLVPKKLIDGL